MNHLAHLYLAHPHPEILLGNIAGDFVKGALGERFSERVRAGIRQHRAIDAFTDSHPSVAAFRQVLVPEHGHYARVIADMFFDHFLANDFEAIAGEPLEAFLERTFATLDPQQEAMPGRLRYVYPMMRDEEWLLSYRDISGIREALAGISRRFSRRPELASAAQHLEISRATLEKHFGTFFPEVLDFARSYAITA